MDLHSVSVTYAWRLSRWWEVSGYGGFARSESKFVELVPLDPVIQALFGVQQGLAISYRTIYVPNVSLRISRTFPRGVLYANGGRTIVPGNGLFLTSVSTTVGARLRIHRTAQMEPGSIGELLHGPHRWEI